MKDYGYSLIVMPPDDDHPDSVFVEDPAVIMNDVLVRTRLQNKHRQGEEAVLEDALRPYFSPSKVFHIEAPGLIEGGDVLVANNALYIGLSKRTNAEGAEQLSRLARDRAGFTTHTLEIPGSYLHLKGEVTFHRSALIGGKNVITVSEEIANHFSTSGCELIVTPPEERFGGNCISDGLKITVHADCTETIRRLTARGFRVIPLAMSEFKKIDGAMTCLSKLF